MLSRRTLLFSLLQRPRPNLVLFLSDDHGFRDSPIYGNRDVRTPNLDRIAKQGLVFTHAFTNSPTCVPSRAILMSGLMSVHNGVQGNHGQMHPDVKTLPTYLKALGYQIAHFGKSHFQPPQNYNDMDFVPSETKGPGPLNADLDPAAFTTWLARRTDPRPLFAIVCSHSPHVYWTANNGYDPNRITLPPTFADTPETRLARCQYYSDITKMDAQLGTVYDAVTARLGPNTLFLYTSDNGAQWPFGKWGLYDDGVRMPMVATWPGVLPAGKRTNALVAFVDLLPTLIQLAGGNPPSGLDGQSFAPVLLNQSRSHRTEVFTTHTGDKDMNVYPMRSVRTARYKYIRNLRPDLKYTTHIDLANPEDGRSYFDTWAAKSPAVVQRYHQRPAEELYDLAADPFETRNLAAIPAHSVLLQTLRRQLDQWMTRQGDRGELFGKPRPL